MDTNLNHWSVTVAVDGDDVLTISHNHVAGKDGLDDLAPAIRTAAAHLLCFIGAGKDIVGGNVALAPSDAAQAPSNWKAIPSLPPVEVMEWYGEQFSVPVLLRDADHKVLLFIARWGFVEDGWVGAHFTEGPSPSDYEWLNERAKEWILFSDAAPVAPKES